MSKLWQKNSHVAASVESFTIGNDQAMDLYLAQYDVLGSIAHATMLSEVGLLTTDEQLQIKNTLIKIYERIEAGQFKLDAGVEDIHSQVEILLTQELGDIGKKIHSARSRNDQVLVDLKLFLRAEIISLSKAVQSFFDVLQNKSEAHKNDLLPGYT
ncbi:MAG: lyase family protein, partial [Chitinophagaceae bacterium]